MGTVCSRRVWLAGALSALPALRAVKIFWENVNDAPFEAIERRVNGRLGVALLDTGTGRRLAYRDTERFALCSTFKFLAVAAVLTRVDAGKDRLDRFVRYGEKDLLEYAPVTKQHVSEGGMTLEALSAAAVEYSDNTAANLLLAAIGGPAALTRYARGLGDVVTRLDRNEPTLNVVNPGDVRDTTSPAAMVGDLKALVAGTALSADSRRRLTAWLIASTTGGERLRAGLPANWRVGDKTGTGANGATNDVAIAWPPGRSPILMAAYLADSPASEDDRNRALADVGRIAASEFGADRQKLRPREQDMGRDE